MKRDQINHSISSQYEAVETVEVFISKQLKTILTALKALNSNTYAESNTQSQADIICCNLSENRFEHSMSFEIL